ncbi:MAG: peptidoglycan binding domain-containing protein [Clostridium sp.]
MSIIKIKNMEVEKVKNKNRGMKIAIGIIISICILSIMYLSISIYFINHFYFGTEISGIDASSRTVEEVEKEINLSSKTYSLELRLRDGNKDIINGSDIGFKFNLTDEVKTLKDGQNPFGWAYGIFNNQKFKLTNKVKYDEELLRKSFEGLACFESKNIVQPENAKLEYINNEYVILDEVKGNKINKNDLYTKVLEAIDSREVLIDVEAINCYEESKYISTSTAIIEARNTLEKYTNSKITYNFGGKIEVVDESKIHDWLKVDRDFNVLINEEAINMYVDTLASIYNTVGDTRDFQTSSGRIAKVSGGDYGWIVNKKEEVQDLIKVIKSGEMVTKKPLYVQSASSDGVNDIGNTYVEIDLTKQYLWFYKNGILIVEGSIVTGNVASNHSTPQGTYKLAYKQKDAILRGVDYVAPVSFWMPFNFDIGLHDATWRSKFGGNIYKTDGSHGCVNAPYNVAEAVFYNIEAGDPVVCYF